MSGARRPAANVARWTRANGRTVLRLRRRRSQPPERTHAAPGSPGILVPRRLWDIRRLQTPPNVVFPREKRGLTSKSAMPAHVRRQAATAGEPAREPARRAFLPDGAGLPRRLPANVARPIVPVAIARPGAHSRRHARHPMTPPLVIRAPANGGRSRPPAPLTTSAAPAHPVFPRVTPPGTPPYARRGPGSARTPSSLRPLPSGVRQPACRARSGGGGAPAPRPPRPARSPEGSA